VPRLAIELPEDFHFETEIRVRITDLNYGAHLGNDAMLTLVHEARVRFLESLGASEADIEGRTMILADAAIVYRAESFAGDVLRFEVACADVQRVSCDFCYRVTRVSDGLRIAEAKTAAVFLDKDTRKPVRVPPLLQSRK